MNTYYEFTVPVFVRSLKNLRMILGKAKEFVAERSIDERDFLDARLIADMYPLRKQVQIACDNAKGAAARLAGIAQPKMEDNEQTFDELLLRIDKTIAFLCTLSPEQFWDAEDRMVSLPWMSEGTYFEAETYLRDFLLPNFFFHYTTAYDILRKEGLHIGKQDFIGNVPMKHKSEQRTKQVLLA